MILPEDILFEDNFLIAVNKSSSVPVVKDKTGETSLDKILTDYLKDIGKSPVGENLGLIHRIDRRVSGVVLFARTREALARMNHLFSERKVIKIYWAVTASIPAGDPGRLEHWLKKNEKQNKSYAYAEPVKGAKASSLSYKIAGQSDRYYLLEIELQTGRHHQIRCQLAAAGCPVKGDLKYGFPRSNEDGSISLHARSLSFIHPFTRRSIVIEAPAPGDKLWNILTS